MGEVILMSYLIYCGLPSKEEDIVLSGCWTSNENTLVTCRGWARYFANPPKRRRVE